MKREALGKNINTEHADAYPFIAPDESYLLFASSRPGAISKETDICISFRNDDDSWSEPQFLSEKVNNGFTTAFPYVTSDGKYLFFLRFNERGTDAFYWVDARILEEMKPDNK